MIQALPAFYGSYLPGIQPELIKQHAGSAEVSCDDVHVVSIFHAELES
jgi:hypothetical protein